MSEPSKTCTQCAEEKPLTEFYRDNSYSRNGRQARCKMCKNAAARVSFANEFPEQKAARLKKQRAYYAKPDVRAARALQNKATRAKNHRKHKQNKRERTYGLSKDAFAELLAIQNGKCAICFTDNNGITPKGHAREFFVDHDHNTGEVRGLLCSLCNLGIGNLRDNAEHLRNAIKYLEHQPAKRLPNKIIPFQKAA